MALELMLLATIVPAAIVVVAMFARRHPGDEPPDSGHSDQYH